MKRHPGAPGGFTLIELMVTMAVFALIAGIAYPSYLSFVRKSNRTDATRTLQQDAQALQRCYSQNFTYLPAGGCPTPQGNSTSPNGYYTINIKIPDATDYIITATPLGGQTADKLCTSLTLSSSGKQSSKDGSGNDTTGTCWGSH
jgi:type IV pilus assembly protein PilE